MTYQLRDYQKSASDAAVSVFKSKEKKNYVIGREIERQFGIPLRRVPLSVDAFSVDYRTMKWFEGIL